MTKAKLRSIELCLNPEQKNISDHQEEKEPKALVAEEKNNAGTLTEKPTSRHWAEVNKVQQQESAQSQTDQVPRRTKLQKQQRGESIAAGLSVFIGILAALLLALLVIGIIMLFKGMFTAALIYLGVFVFLILLFFLANLL